MQFFLHNTQSSVNLVAKTNNKCVFCGGGGGGGGLGAMDGAFKLRQGAE